MIKPIFWEQDRLFIIDQTLLPLEYRRIEIHDHLEMADAIKRLAIRGAPAIGIAAAYGLVTGLRAFRQSSTDRFLSEFKNMSKILLSTRPTAVNLGHILKFR